MFKSAGTSEEGLKNHYTLIVPFTAQEGFIAGGTKIAELHDVNGGVFDITTPSAAIDLSQKQLNRFTVSESLVAGLTTVSAGVENWGEADVNTSVAGLDYDVQSDGTYHIYTGEGLKAWRSAANNGNTSAKLMNDIVMPSGWSPVDDFNGTFDGNGKTISDLSLNLSSGYPGGIFNILRGGAVVKNLTVEIAGITTTATHTGGIIGGTQLRETEVGCIITVENCKAIGKAGVETHISTSTGSVIGGVLGYGRSGLKMSGCSSEGLKLNNGATAGDAGAVIGQLDGDMTLNACYASGFTIDCTNRGGGIIGRLNYNSSANTAGSVITACYAANGTVKGKYAGGIIGDGNANGTMISCYSTGITLEGSSNNGGLVGRTNPGTITTCFTTVTAQGNNGANDIAGTYIEKLGDTQKNAMNASLSGLEYKSSEGVFPFEIKKQ